MTIIPDEALVVRGGRNRPEDIRRGIGTHPSGITGISVECAVGSSLAELASSIPHGQIGVTTVGEVRQAGGDVIRTSGRSANHETSCISREKGKGEGEKVLYCPLPL
ncbi:flavoredoxin [Nostoc sp. UHCC 0251]|uniref:flavoredoxin n=1 Tax=Nostoc sp. UHCC 0251 TaxID=3110240 RepID=UPI002B1F5C3D|nr:flavoredoxin [Nostoc sp. UHCC 0251]MEA5624541.1 flavoredoxin [Nostoc sp. UHCC 0251]